MTLLASVVFFLSGFAALLYQVTWQRLLVIFSGADVYSATLIVTAFMGGLGLGSLIGGAVADRTSARTSLALFAVAELATAVFGRFSAWLYYDYLYQQLGRVDIGPVAMGAVLFLSLLWPTLFMGASLPLLARALTLRVESAPRIIGLLYGVNTLGAAAGAAVSTWRLLPSMGLDGATQAGSALNVACALVLFPLAWSMTSAPQRVSAAEPIAPVSPTDASVSTGLSFRAWVVVFALSGALALSLEIIWFRIMGVMMKATAFTFGTMLTLFLLGIGGGSLIGSLVAPRIRRPAMTFFGLQAAATLCGAALLTALVRLVDDIPAVWTYLGSYEALSVRGEVARLRNVLAGSAEVGTPLLFLGLYVGIPALLIVPSTLMMGCAFPVVQRGTQTDIRHVGGRVGVLLLANIIGSMAGTAVTGWVLLDFLGTAATLRLVTLASAAFAILAFTQARGGHSQNRMSLLTAAATALAYGAVLVETPDMRTLWAKLHGADASRVVIGEDRSGVSLIKTLDATALVFVNGVGQSVMPYGDVHTALGALPVFIHPAPTTAAIIGLGSGDTVHAAAGRRDLDQITGIEIIGAQLTTLRTLNGVWSYAGLEQLLSDGRVRFLTGDGRIFLMRGRTQFDIVEADALRPSSAYSGNLYSEGYFTLVRESLKPGGLAATWSPTVRVHNAFVRVFPYVISVPGLLLGSQTPIAVDRDAIAARLDASNARAYYAAAGIDIDRMFAEYLANPVYYGPDFARDRLTDFNSDLFPRDEFDLSPPSP